MSKNEICRYHNDLNKVRLPNLNELQLNLFYTLLFKMRNKQQGELVKFSADEIENMLLNAKKFERSEKKDYRFTNAELLEITKNLFEKLFQTNFKRIYPTKERYINLFKVMDIDYEDDKQTRITGIKLETNEHFEYLLGELQANYTEFELTEFASVIGKYSKVLYTHLKQYRSTGFWLVKWEDFKEILGIPQSYRVSDIEKQILNPAIKELTAERTLFDQTRIPFKNLKYKMLTKNKEPNLVKNKNGKLVKSKIAPHYIQLTFKQEIISEPKPKSEAQIAVISKNLTNDDIIGKSFLDDYNGEKQIFRIDKIIDKPKENRILLACSIFDKNFNLLSGYYTKSFSNSSSAKKFVIENEYKIS